MSTSTPGTVERGIARQIRQGLLLRFLFQQVDHRDLAVHLADGLDSLSFFEALLLARTAERHPQLADPTQVDLNDRRQKRAFKNLRAVARSQNTRKRQGADQ